MNAGDLNERVSLFSRSVVKDDHGQDQITWVSVVSVWAVVRPLSSREFFAAAQVQQDQTVKIIIRRRIDVQTTWRLVWRGAAHDVTGVLHRGAEWTELLCRAGVKDGR